MERRSERRARERQERKAQNRVQPQGRHEISRRNFLIGGAVGAVGITAAVIIGRDQLFENSSDTPNSASNEPKRFSPEVPESDFKIQASKAIDDYKRILNPDLDKQFLLNNIVYVPNLAKLSTDVRDDLCSYVICTDAAGYIGGKKEDGSEDKIYVFKDKVELRNLMALQKLPQIALNSPQTIKELVNTYMRQVILHELTHFTARERFPMSAELDSMCRKYAGEQAPQLRDEELYRPNYTRGFSVNYIEADGVGGAGLFRGIEEAIAISADLYVSKITSSDPRLISEDKTYFYSQHKLLSELISKLPNTTVKTIIDIRKTPQPLEELIKIVGRNFEGEESKQFEKGFQILWAIDSGKEDQFKQLTSKG